MLCYVVFVGSVYLLHAIILQKVLLGCYSAFIFAIEFISFGRITKEFKWKTDVTFEINLVTVAPGNPQKWGIK